MSEPTKEALLALYNACLEAQATGDPLPLAVDAATLAAESPPPPPKLLPGYIHAALMVYCGKPEGDPGIEAAYEQLRVCVHAFAAQAFDAVLQDMSAYQYPIAATIAEQVRTRRAAILASVAVDNPMPPASPSPPVCSIWKHKRRGTRYHIIGQGSVQIAVGPPIREGETLVIYEDEEADLWLRRPAEFLDGRFEPADLSRRTRK